MIRYILRRLLYAFPILIGVNLITFFLFFVVNTPDNMARIHLGVKHVTPEAIQQWKREHGYDKPLFLNRGESGFKAVTDTLFVDRSLKLFAFDFGKADDGRDIARDIKFQHRVAGSAGGGPGTAPEDRHSAGPAWRPHRQSDLKKPHP